MMAAEDGQSAGNNPFVIMANFRRESVSLSRLLRASGLDVLRIRSLRHCRLESEELPSAIFISLANGCRSASRCASELLEHEAFSHVPYIFVGSDKLINEMTSSSSSALSRQPAACLSLPVDRAELAENMARCSRVRRCPDSRQVLSRPVFDAELFSSILQQIPLGVTVSEAPAGNVIISNSSASALLGKDVSARRTWRELNEYGAIRADGKPVVADEYPMTRALLLGEEVEGEEMTYVAPDGTRRILEVSAKPLITAQNRFVVSTFLDITKEREAFQELAQAKENIEEFFMQAPAAMVMLQGPEHLFTLANSHYETFVGRKVLGKTVFEAFSASEVGDFVARLDDVYRSGQAYTAKEMPIDLPNPAGDLKRSWINIGYHPVRSAAGNVTGLIAIHEDVTEHVETRKKLEYAARVLKAEEEKLLAMFEQSPVGVALMVGPDFTFEKVNAKWTELASARHYMGRKFTEVYSGLTDSSLHAALQQVYCSGTLFQAVELRVKSQMLAETDTYRYYDISYVRLSATETATFSILAQASDVTERVQARLELEYAKIAAESANATKSAFVANMSHEIRTPLGAIIGFINLLEDPDLPSSAARDYISVINRNSNHLLRLVDDVLDLAKVEAGKVEIEQAEFSLIEFFSEFCSFFNLRALDNRVRFDFVSETLIPEFVVSDSTRIRQILSNLVGNAIKFSPHGRVTLGFSFDGEVAHFTVKDNGRGISKEQAARLFKPFVQADDSTTRKFGGTGLGLALAKNLCQALGGDLRLKYSALETGSCFAADLPLTVKKASAFVSVQELSAPGHQVCEPVDRQYPSLKDLDLLVVEDSSDNQILIAKIVDRVGSRVTMASNGLEGVEKGLSHTYDVILMDIQMPMMDGHQAVKRLRAHGYSGPIVALTAHAMKDEVEKTAESGFSHFLSKPIIRSKLLDLLSTLRPH